MINKVKKLNSFYKNNKEYIIIQLKYFLYYLVLTNILRYMLIYKNSTEAFAMDSRKLLSYFLLFDRLGDIYRSSIGSTTENFNARTLYKNKDSVIENEIENEIKKENIVNNKCREKIIKIVEESLFRCLVVDSIMLPMFYVILYFIHILNIVKLDATTVLLFSVYLMPKWLLIHNTMIRNILDLIHPTITTIISAVLQVSFPIIYYKIRTHYSSESIQFTDIIIGAYLGGLAVFLCNYIKLCFVLKKVLIPKYIPWGNTVKKALILQPGNIAKAMMRMCLVEYLEIFSIVKNPKEKIIEGILLFSLIKAVYGTFETPLTSTLSIAAPKAKNNKHFLNSSYVTTLIISILGTICLSLTFKYDLYRKIFFLKSPGETGNFNYFLLLMPLSLLQKPMEVFNVINNQMRYFTITVILADMSAFVAYNLLYFYGITEISKRLAPVLIFRYVILYFLNIVSTKMLDRDNSFSIIKELIFSTLTILSFILIYKIIF